MQQDRAGGSEHIKQNQDHRRLKPPTAQGEIPHQPQQPQKCPRCESMNTKFCYYNNYSLSQPRYFCKTCRRYWTQGGTLRNVPVGGGCRKGKRAKTSTSSSSSDASRASQSQLQTPQTSFSLTSSGSGSGTSAPMNPVVPAAMGTFYNSDAGGFLTSLAAIHTINNQPPHSFTLTQPVNLGGDLGGSSNLGLLHGFNAISSFGSSQSRQLSSYFPFEESLPRPGNRVAGGNPSQQQQQNWHQGFPGNANNSSIVSDTALWSISTTTAAAGNSDNSNTAVGSSSSLNPDHRWPDLPGYGNPP